MSVYRSVRLSLFICAIFGALIACEPGTSPEDATASQYGTVALPLTSVGDLGEVFQIEEAYLSLKGPQSAHIFIDPNAGEHFERTIRTGTYTLEVLGSVRMTRRDYQGAVHSFIAELDGPAPTFEITPGQVTPVTLRLVSPIYDVPTGEPSTGTFTIETEVTFEEVAVECHPGTFEAIDCGHNLQGRSSRVCEEGQWGEWTPCDAPEGCEPGDSEWMSCVRPDGASGAMNLVCDQDGQWDTDGECAAFVSDDSPGTDQCEPGTFEYSGCELEDGSEGEGTLFCDDSGQWTPAGPCAEQAEIWTHQVLGDCEEEGVTTWECENDEGELGTEHVSCVDGQAVSYGCVNIPGGHGSTGHGESATTPNVFAPGWDSDNTCSIVVNPQGFFPMLQGHRSSASTDNGCSIDLVGDPIVVPEGAFPSLNLITLGTGAAIVVTMTGVTPPATPVSMGVGLTYECTCPDGDKAQRYVSTLF